MAALSTVGQTKKTKECLSEITCCLLFKEAVVTLKGPGIFIQCDVNDYYMAILFNACVKYKMFKMKCLKL